MSVSQITTFKINGHLYGLDVQLVQEITRPMQLTRVPLAAPHIAGLMNLRGQIATTIDLKVLFGIKKNSLSKDASDSSGNNVICRDENFLLAFLVDEAGDVVEVTPDQFEPTPETVSSDIKKYMNGVYKVDKEILSVLDLKKITSFLNS